MATIVSDNFSYLDLYKGSSLGLGDLLLEPLHGVANGWRHVLQIEPGTPLQKAWQIAQKILPAIGLTLASALIVPPALIGSLLKTLNPVNDFISFEVNFDFNPQAYRRLEELGVNHPEMSDNQILTNLIYNRTPPLIDCRQAPLAAQNGFFSIDRKYAGFGHSISYQVNPTHPFNVRFWNHLLNSIKQDPIQEKKESLLKIAYVILNINQHLLSEEDKMKAIAALNEYSSVRVSLPLGDNWLSIRAKR